MLISLTVGPGYKGGIYIITEELTQIPTRRTGYIKQPPHFQTDNKYRILVMPCTHVNCMLLT